MNEKYPFTVKSFYVPREEVLRGDVVKIADSDLDWLRDFSNERNDGKPIHMFSNNFCIEILNDMEGCSRNEKMLFYVRSLEDGNYIQVDMYRCVGAADMSIWTEVLDNSKVMDCVDGRYKMQSYTILHPMYGDVSKYMIAELSTYISDVVHYVLMYMMYNIDNPEYVDVRTEMTTTRKCGKEKKNRKKLSRRKVYVPKKITVRSDKPERNEDDATGNQENTSTLVDRTYYCEKWKVREHERKVRHKDGSVTIIKIPEKWRKRNPKLLGNNGEGIDYVLRKRNS